MPFCSIVQVPVVIPTPPTIEGVATENSSASASNDPTVEWPASLMNNDVVIAGIHSNNPRDMDGSLPTGWTKITEVDIATGNTSTMGWFWHLSDGTETGDETFTDLWTDAVGWKTVAFKVRGANTTTPIDQTATASQSSTTAFSVGAITPSEDDCLVIAWAGFDGDSSPATFASWGGTTTEFIDAGSTPSGDHQFNASAGSQRIAHVTQTTAAAVTSTATASEAVDVVSILMSIKQ